MKDRILISIIVFLIFLALGVGIQKIVDHMTYSETREYAIEEIENGKYVLYQRAVSTIPSQNYEMATLCVGGNIVMVKGNVRFVFENDVTEKAIIKRTHIINGDTVTIYVSKDKVEYADTITVR